jgi:hypothetical protein
MQRALKIDEHALYPLLSLYLWEEFGVFSKRIDEKRSSNKRGPNGNRWLYPDVVGMEDLGAEWHQEVRDCVTQYSDKRTKLWSFEAKLLINRSNVRECFFQAVSNSSWANFGYLLQKCETRLVGGFLVGTKMGNQMAMPALQPVDL